MTTEDIRTPVMVLSGFLGAGKTTLLTHLLTNTAGLRVAIIVNDMSEVNVDAELLRASGLRLSRTEETLVELSNGCICCTLRDDLLGEVRQLCSGGRYDYLLIESTGISEPLPVAATFEYCDETQASLAEICRLDAMVTVVDAANLPADFDSRDLVRDRGEARDDDDARAIVELLVDQIEFADIVVLNKIGTAGPARTARARRIVRMLNPEARLIETDHGRVTPGEVLGTGLFSPARARSHPLWFKELNGFADHVPETEEYGISSFVYRARAPFDAAAINRVLTGDIPGLMRAKGHFWVASRPDTVLEYSVAGALMSIRPAGRWWAALPRAAWPADPAAQARIRARWEAPWGDRRQELVFIGTGLDRAAITRALDGCLVTQKPALSPRRLPRRAGPLPVRAGHRQLS